MARVYECFVSLMVTTRGYNVTHGYVMVPVTLPEWWAFRILENDFRLLMDTYMGACSALRAGEYKREFGYGPDPMFSVDVSLPGGADISIHMPREVVAAYEERAAKKAARKGAKKAKGRKLELVKPVAARSSRRARKAA